MIRSFIFIAILAASALATTSTSTLACQSISVTPTAGSICSSQTWSVCSTAAGASLAQAALQASWSSLTSQTAVATGNMACSPIGGTAINAFWTSPSTWHCDANPEPCDPTKCGTTSGSPPPSPQPFCCAYVRQRIQAACANVPNLDTLITPSGMGNGTSVILSSLGFTGVCSDTNCDNAASGLSVSIMTLLVAAIVALFNL